MEGGILVITFHAATHTEALERAEKAVQKAVQKAQKSEYRHQYHFMAPAGWINDPNGLIYYQDEYHLFYQYNPYSAQWDSMHWGHAKSRDLIHWEHLPIALAPSEDYDWYGCFSGTSFVHNGKLFLFYCGTYYVGEQLVQCQCMAYTEDGIHFIKSKDNPIIAMPPAHCTFDFRDPSVFEKDGTVYMLIASATTDGHGCVLLYTADDDSLAHWTFRNNFAEAHGELGDIWECPCLCPLGEKDALFLSAMHAGGRRVPYLLGNVDYDAGRLYWNGIGEADWGFDFYAPQIICDEKGRNIMIGWMNSWKWVEGFAGFGLESQDGWCGSMAFPRTVRLSSDKTTLLFEPVEEIMCLRRKKKEVGRTEIENNMEMEIPTERTSSMEIRVLFDKQASTATECGFVLRNRKQECSRIRWCRRYGQLIIERTAENGTPQSKTVDFDTAGCTEVDFRLLIDTCSVEIFALAGKFSFTYRLYGNPCSGGCFVYTQDGRTIITEMESFVLEN